MAILGVISLAVILALTHGALGTTNFQRSEPGALGGASFSFEHGGRIALNVTGTESFDLYVMTVENFERYTNNSSFGYIDRLSAINVTSADIDGELPAGQYVYWLYAYGAGNFTVWKEEITPSSDAMDIPWSMILPISIVAIVTAGVTFFITRSRYRRAP